MIGTIFSNIFAALIVLGVIIVIHELGHFLVAKLFGIRVEAFSVGFGPRLFGYRYGDTDYRVSAFPLGGYVKMAGEIPGEDRTGDPDEFLSKPKWQRFLVAFAGPAMNGVLAIVLLTGLYMYASEVEAWFQSPAVVGYVESDSPAAAAGIQPGDRIVEIAGEVDPTWQALLTEVALSPDLDLPVRIDREGREVSTTLTPSRQPRDETGYSGLIPDPPTVVAGFSMDGSPAEEAGLLVGDEIVAIGETELGAAAPPINELVQTYPAELIPIRVDRDGEQLSYEVGTTVNPDGQRVIGINLGVPMETIQLSAPEAFGRSLQVNGENAMLIFEILGRLIKRETSMRSLDGPIGIIRVSGQMFQEGLAPLISLMALISLNLGIINLLPIPILDGGVMLLLLIEGLMRQDLSLAVKERIVQVSFVFLLAIIAVVIYNDVVKILPVRSEVPAAAEPASP
jgi:regulator of sigma E protease